MSKSDAKIAAEKDVADKRVQINAGQCLFRQVRR